MNHNSSKCFDAYEVSLLLARSLAPLLDRVRTADKDLERQLRRAACSVVLNVTEGRARTGRDAMHLWSVAYGSAREVRAALTLAVIFGYCEQAQCADAFAFADRLGAMLYRLSRR